MTKQAPPAWRTGFLFLLPIPFIGLGLQLFDPPVWVEIVGVVAMLSLVFVGSRLMLQRRGGWLPSDTLPDR